MILHLPHSSRFIPDDVRRAILLNDEALEAELLRMTDAFTDELFALPGATRIVHPVSRLVVDPERFPEDHSEPMAARGMGAVYTLTSEGRPLRPEPSAEERASLFGRFYAPHHDALEGAVDTELHARGNALIIDGHSFPSRPIPCDLNQSEPRPEICLGTDANHTPGPLLAAAFAAFASTGWRVEVNRPYAGTLVPLKHYGRDQRVASLMVEIRRDLYMDEETGERGAAFAAIREVVAGLLGRLEVWHQEQGQQLRIVR